MSGNAWYSYGGMRTLRILVLLAYCSLLVGPLEGCGNSSSTNHVNRVEQHSQQLFVHSFRSGVTGSAAMSGRLSLNQDRCLGVGEYESFTVVVFPYGTRWLSQTSVRLLGKTVAIGQGVQLGGGVSETKGLLSLVSQHCPNARATVFDAG